MTNQTVQPDSFFREAYRGARRRLEFGDALIFLYTLVLARQYFWVIENNLIAWTLTVALAAICWYFYLATKQFPAEKSGRSFWLVVGLPLLGFYLLRAALPFNPVPDTLTGISRLFLGFRLGTVINLLALIWAAQIADKLLRPFIDH